MREAKDVLFWRGKQASELDQAGLLELLQAVFERWESCIAILRKIDAKPDGEAR